MFELLVDFTVQIIDAGVSHALRKMISNFGESIILENFNNNCMDLIQIFVTSNSEIVLHHVVLQGDENIIRHPLILNAVFFKTAAQLVVKFIDIKRK